MKILLVHNYYQDAGGEDSVFQSETDALKQNHDVEILTFKNKKGFKGLFQFLLYPYNIFAAQKLKKKIKEFKPSIIHIHNIHYASGPILFRTSARLNIPTVFTLHNYRMICPSALLFFKDQLYLNSVGKSFPWDAVFKGVLDHSILKTFWTAFTYKLHAWLGTWKRVSVYLPLTQFAKDLFEKGELGKFPDKIIVKANFISTTEHKNNTKTVERPSFLYIGRLSEEKGVKQLVQAFNKPDAPPLKIIGKGPLLSELENTEFNNIEYLGFVQKEELPEYLQQSKGLIIPSVCFEGFPLTMLDAFATKTPVIVSNIVAASEIIKDGENGFLIDPFDFSERIKEIYDLPELEMVAEKGYKTYEKSYTESIIMNQLEKIYEGIIR